MDTDSETVNLLREIRDQQRVQLERQAEAMALQREQVAMVRQQLERAERIQTRAEALQGRAGKAVRVIIWVALPLVVILVLLVIASTFSAFLHR
ncbi:MAG TPA: hypothetical protein VGT79_05055 [Xanthomonadaceae bacterium]|nr:hypothetical protein [Xanthomonadaceae bacterium]